MQTLGSLLVSLVVASSSIVAAAPPANNDAFIIPVHPNAKFSPSGPASVARTYRKYHKPVPHDVLNALKHQQQRRDTGSVVATPQEYDGTFLSPVQIGTPPQTLDMCFDTGSSDFWVFSTLTVGSEADGHTLYDPQKSSTSKLQKGQTWNITYSDDGYSAGVVYDDVVSIGGVVVKSQAVQAAVNASSEFANNDQLDGLVGLGFDSINDVAPVKQKTFFSNAKLTLDQPLFTANLKHNASGTYTFGCINPSEHLGSITYTPVDSSMGVWNWTSTGYAVGSGKFIKAPIPGIADTGTTLLYLPDNIIKAYYGHVKGAGYDSWQGGYTFPCSSWLPSLSFGVSGSTITVPGKYINFASLNSSSPNCFGGLQSSKGLGTNVFGDVAIKSAFVVFDGGSNRLGWAPKKL